MRHHDDLPRFSSSAAAYPACRSFPCRKTNRAGSVAAKAQDVHGPGTSRVSWCDNSVYMLTTGMSKLTREREFAVWDARSMSAPVSRTRVGGTSSGFLLPRLQYGLGLLTLCGRGDSTVR